MFAWLKRLWGRFFGYAKRIDPQIIPCADRKQAETAARAFAANTRGYFLREVAATGSMAPLVPAQPGFMVAKRIPFADVKLGTVVTYWPDYHLGKNYMHRLVSKDRLGFLASGDASPRTESWARVTENNFEGEVLRVWHYPA